MSTTVAAWNFNNDSNNGNGVLLNPATSTGSGTAYSIGMQSGTSNANSPGGTYAYPAVGASGVGTDASLLLAGTGSADTGANGGSEDGTAGNVWKIVGGWDNTAALASQGVQFSASTAGATGINVSFDMNPSSTGAPAQFAVEYTTNGSTWTNITQNLTFGANDTANTQGHVPTLGTSPSNDVYIQTNSSNPNIVTGTYATITGPIVGTSNTSWLNDLTLNSTLPAAAENNPNFGIRIVNAANGSAETNIAGAAYGTASNWRFDDVQILAGAAALTAPSVTLQPTSVSTQAGQPVSFTASASGNPTPTVQWQVSTNGGSSWTNTTDGALYTGSTTNTLSFTASSAASENGYQYRAAYTNNTGTQNTVYTNAATLTDPLAAVAITTQPTAQSVTAGNTATFTAAATGSPVPTVQWQSGSSVSGPFTNISGATSATYSFVSANGNNGTYYRAVFTNSQSPSGVATNAVLLTVNAAATTNLAVWTFENDAVATNNFPATSSGTGSASSLGMTVNVPIQSISGNGTTVTVTTASPLFGVTSGSLKLLLAGNSTTAFNGQFTCMVTGTSSFTFPSTTSGGSTTLGTVTGYGTANVGVSFDDVTTGATSDTGTNGLADLTNIWRVRAQAGANGTANGWSSFAPIGSQGAQFAASTVGYGSITVGFDWYATSAGEAKLQLQYTTDGTTWTNAPITVPGADTSIAALSNSSSASTVNGSYIQISAGQQWAQNLTATITDPAAANNSNFAFRLVNASTGADDVNTTGAALNNTSGNWRFDNVSIVGTALPAAPAVTMQPASASVVAGSNASFTAVASGNPAPTAQWQVSTNGGTTWNNDTTDTAVTTPSGNSASSTLTVTAAPAADNNDQYRVIFTNNVSPNTATSSPATLTVTTLPTITTNPLSQTVNAGATNVTFTAAATGSPTPTVQWEVEAPGSSSFAPVTGSDYSGATSPTLTILTADEGLTGNQYEAVFTNSNGSATTTAATLTVTGTPIAQWIFTSGYAAPGGTTITQGTGNSPNPTFGTIGSISSNTPDSAVPIGLINDYTGTEAFPESDVIPLRSSVNSNFVEYVWRLRSGNGSGPTGSPGTPEGWSQNAPQYSQGVQFNVDTTGYSDVTLHFDWNQGGISDMQPLYSTDGGQTWNVLPNGLITQTAPSGDYYGITPTTKPTGITVNLQGIAGVNNNPNFQLRLAAAYDPSLPLITDGNEILNGGNTSIPHGQYASGIAGAVNAQQVIQFGTDENSTSDVTGGTFTLTYNGTTTGPINFDSNPTNLAANITAALTPLIGSGNFTVAQTNPPALQPERDGLGVVASTMTVTFKGTLAATAVPTMTANGTGLTGSNPSLAVQDYVNGSKTGFSPYVDGGGAWELGNFSFNGFTANADGLGITSQPAATQVAGGGVATFTASAYSEATPTVTWQVSTNGGASWSTATGTTSPVTFTNASNNSYTSTFSYTSHVNLSDNGYEFRAVFSVGGSSVNSNAATLTVVQPVAPTVVIQPTPISVLVGDLATDTSTASGAPTPTVQWQISSDGGSTWTNISGATTSNLSFTPTAGQNNDLVRAQFTNAVSTVNSNAVTLHVLAAETDITNWDFDNSQYASAVTNDSLILNPAPSGGVVQVGQLQPVGMNLPYTNGDSASGTDGNGATANADIVLGTSTQYPSFSENVWRVRGGVPNIAPGSAGTPANGWSNFVAQYSQGAQVSVPTTGYQNVYVTMDWYSTHSAELDAQEQYTVGGTTVSVTAASSALNFNIVTGTSGDLNVATLSAPNSFKFGDEVTVTGGSDLPSVYQGTFQVVSATPTSFSYYIPSAGTSWSGTASAYVPTWINLGNPIQNNTTAAANDEFYGATPTNPPTPVVFDLTGISGVANNPNFGIRLVNAYDPYLSNTQTLTLGDANSFKLSFNGQTTGSIASSSNTTTQAANIQMALGALSSVGSPNVTVSYNSTTSNYSITFGNALSVVAQPPVTVVGDANDAIATHYQFANATEVGSPLAPVPYNGGKGNWRFGNIEVHGIAIPPIVSSITPTSGPAAGGTTVTINGTGFTGATAVDFGATPASSFTVNSTGTQITVLDPAGSGTADVTVVGPGGTSATSAADKFTYAASAVSVTSVVVNGNNPALAGAQRSMVNSIVYSFNQAVTLATANAFSIALHASQTGTLPTLNWAAISPDASGASTQWVVTFSGAGVTGGSIGDGVYDITLNVAAVTSESNPAASVTPRATDTFYRLYGDAQGTGKVNTSDYGAFLTTFGLKSSAAGYLAYFADDGSGKIDTSDYGAFLANFGKKLSGFTATI